MTRLTDNYRLLMSFCVMSILRGTYLTAADVPPVRVQFHPFTEVGAGVVRLGEIAEISGGAEADRRAIGGVDIAEISADQPRLVLDHNQIRLRLELADIASGNWVLAGADPAWILSRAARSDATREEIARRSFAVESVAYRAALQTGSSSARVTEPQVNQEASLLTRVRDELAHLAGLPAEEFLVQLALPLPARLGQLDPEVASLIPKLTSAVPLGRRRIEIREFQQGQLHQVHSITVDIQRRMQVPLLNARIEANSAVHSGQVRWESRLVVDPDSVLRPDEIDGCVAARTLHEGQVVQRRDLRRAVASQTPDIRARAVVRVVAQRGRLTVTLANGEALQSGHVGDSIRVRNPQSGQIITGQVVGSNEVRVAL